MKNHKESTKAPHHWPICEEELLLTDGLPAQKASNAESASMSWRHYVIKKHDGGIRFTDPLCRES